jgi:hypothetical protein
LVRTVEEIRQRWSERSRAGALHPHLEITGEGLVLGAGTILAKMGGDSKGSLELSLDDERRIMAILATAYGRPLQAHVLAKMRRAAELWNGGDKALAHIHLAFAGLPPCDDMDLALRLFVADELIEAGASPTTLMKAQGFDPAPLDMLKFNPAQPRWPAGNGDESGEWSGGGDNITPVAFRGGKERRRQRGRGRFNPFRTIGEFIDEFRKPKEREPVPEAKRPEREDAKPESTSPSTSRPQTEISAPNPSDFVGQDFGKLGVGVENPKLNVGEFSEHATERVKEYGASLTDIEDTVANPLMVLRQSDGRFFYLSEKAVVLLDQSGRVITIYTEPQFDSKIRGILESILKGGNK